MENKTPIILGFREKDVLKILYQNQVGLVNKEISELLKMVPSGVSVIISRLSKYNPPLIRMESISKFKRYILTKDGRKYCEEYLFNQPNPLLSINSELGIILITDILNKIDPNTDNSLIQDIKQLGVNTITSILNIHEFFFLALNLGMITPKPMSTAEAIKVVFPEVGKENYMEYSKSIYEKLKFAILKSKKDELEQRIQECIEQNVKCKESFHNI